MKILQYSTLALILLGSFSFAQEEKKDDAKKQSKKNKNLPIKADRFFELNTDTGTWISLDVSPDGSTIVFDMLGDIYSIPINGGEAKRITKGMAYDSHPRFSPDGNSIVYTSDKSGNVNVWTRDLETNDSLQITKGKDNQTAFADWSKDGDYIIASTGFRNLKLHMYHKEGGSGVQLVGEPSSLKIVQPAVSHDDRYIWYAERRNSWQYNASFPQYQISNMTEKQEKLKEKHQDLDLHLRQHYHQMENGLYMEQDLKIKLL